VNKNNSEFKSIQSVYVYISQTDSDEIISHTSWISLQISITKFQWNETIPKTKAKNNQCSKAETKGVNDNNTNFFQKYYPLLLFIVFYSQWIYEFNKSL